MNLQNIKHLLHFYKHIRKAEGHLVSTIAVVGRANNHLSGSIKLSKCGIFSSLVLASRFLQENPVLSKMDVEFTNNMGVLSPPDTVRGMRHLNRTMFERNVLVPTLKVPKQKMHLIVKNKSLSKSLLKFRGIPNVIDPTENADQKVILLNPNTCKNPSDMDPLVVSELEKAGVSLQSWATMAITLNYDNWNHREVLAAILPIDSPAVSGFSSIGHILHLNIKTELLDYKTIIGEVILDKIKSARTVVNKTGIIDNTFRNFQMEVLAGDEDFITVTQECGATYQMDFSKVYWNSRLAFEHERMAAIFQPEDIVFDMFAGIGPFSIPAAKKKCIVFANDLNPESYKWLNENVKRNKIKGAVQTYNLDGRDFARDVIALELPRLLQSESGDRTIHIVMNLPAIAIEFTDVFPGLLEAFKKSQVKVNQEMLPVKVYCYCFSKEKDPQEEIRQRLEQSMGRENVPEFEVKYVRNVAPSKEMYRVMFPLSWSLLTRSPDSTDENNTATASHDGDSTTELGQSDNGVEPPDKKMKTGYDDVNVSKCT